MPADMITKALNDLTQALKGKSNQQGIDQIEALTKLNVILNNAPEPDPESYEPTIPTEPRRVTFDKTAKSPQIEEPIPTPRVMRPLECTQPEPMHKVTIDKIIPNAQTPRVEKTKSNPNNNDNREPIRNYIASKTMARIPLRKSYLRQSTRTTERAQTIYNEEMNTYLKYRQLMGHPKYKKVWSKSSANKFGRLANGLADWRIEKPTKTIRFIRKEDVPADRRKDVTYGSFSCDYKPNKKEQNRTRLTMGGDRINYPDDCGTPTADMILFKILANSIISTPNAKCLMMDIKDFYLNTPMKRPEYMRLKLTDIPDEVIKHYNLRELATADGYVYCEVSKGM
jgi:hypothetical protein